MTAPVASTFEGAYLFAAVAAESLPVDLTGAVVNTDGWENVVVQTTDGWILRFPRNDQLPFDREVAILRALAGRLPVPIPEIAHVGQRTRFAAYRKLTGADFDREAYLSAPPAERDLLAGSLARFLVAMHASLDRATVAALGIEAVDHPRALDIVVTGIPTLPAEHRAMVEALAEAFAGTWAAGRVAGPSVVLHNDFHTFNMVFEPPGPVSPLAGIWDFSCVQTGEPSYDLRYLDGGPRDLLDRVADHYQQLSGRQVDVPAAVVANRLENISDAIETGRPELIERALQRWSRTDSGR